jgi:hypothetical protein
MKFNSTIYINIVFIINKRLDGLSSIFALAFQNASNVLQDKKVDSLRAVPIKKTSNFIVYLQILTMSG